jgi:hypothetical protein
MTITIEIYRKKILGNKKEIDINICAIDIYTNELSMYIENDRHYMSYRQGSK